MPVPVVIALGGNLGDVRSTGAAALAQLHETPGVNVQQISHWYSTEPVGCEGRFLNAAALLSSELTPTQLLLRMLEIEVAHGRQRTGGHWTPRPLDLDLILFGQWQIVHPQLKLPHPEAWCRRFVLDPACEVAGDLMHPGFGMSLNELRNRLLPRPLAMSWNTELFRETVTQGTVQARLGSQVHWASSEETGIVRFVPSSEEPIGKFEVAVPHDLDQARRIVIETLTSLLDQPIAVDYTSHRQD